MVMSAASVGLNLLQDMNEPVFEMKFESLSPTSKVAYRLVAKEALYNQLSPCRNLTEVNSRSYGLPLIKTLTRGPYSVLYTES